MEQKDPKDYIEEIDLQKYWLVLKRHWLVASGVFITCVAASAYFALTQKTVYKATGELIIRTDRTSALTGVGVGLGDPKGVTVKSDPLVTQSAIFSSLPVLTETVVELDLKSGSGAPLNPKAIKRGLTVSPVAQTDILLVSYESPNPELAAAIVNQLMKSYITINIQTNRAEATAARKFIEKQLPQAEAAVNQTAEALRQFKADNRIISLDQEARATVNEIANLDKQINQVQSQLAEVDTRAATLRQKLGMPLEQAATVSSLSQSLGVQNVLAALQAVQSQLADAQARYTSSHPTIRALQRQEAAQQQLLQARIAEVIGVGVNVPVSNLQMDSLRQDLTSQLAQAEISRLSLLSNLDTLSATRDAYIDWADVFPSLEKTQFDLERQFSAASSTYQDLQKRFQEIRLAENQNVGSAQILESASTPKNPIETGKNKYLFGGAVVGGLLGVAAAFFLDLIDKSVKTAKDAEALFGYTLLGVIPKFDTQIAEETLEEFSDSSSQISPRIVAFSYTHPLISGSYQMLQANLKFMSSDKKFKTLVITSSVPKEGKSEVCANLAATLAQVGQRVLLVDADLRSPCQHHLWNVMNTVGLTHVLVGEGKLNQAAKKVAGNLTILTAGVVPPNPLALLDSERMVSLIELFSQQFDYVIFDTPPLVGAAEAAILGKATDGVLLVTRPRLVDSISAISADSLLSRSGARVLGLIANGVELNNEHDRYNYYTQTQLDQGPEESADWVNEAAFSSSESL
ncbi:MAG: polysaccharide biosynthesis tyrosine autokinase [Leptolyngbyaceae cyanobacterium MO_188.B28]|nr:polysaccharide biosynthesis tyrosine autokinase [Leptolyngbyaceae cyanobacterium MO_188.B28]